MKLYSILLVLFIFGFVSEGINASGMFAPTIPTSDITFNEADVEEVTEGIQGIGSNPFSLWMAVMLFVRIFGSALLAIVTILPILASWGVPLWAGMMVQGPVWFVELIGLYQFVTGHNMIGME